MRVALFRELPYDFPGGVSNLLSILVDYLERHGCQVRVFIPEDGADGPPPWPFVGFPTVTTRSWARSRFCLPVPWPPKVRRELEAFRPDVVHFLHPMVLGPLGSFWARRLKVARVASYHTLYHEYASYHGLGFLKGALHWWMRKVFEDCHLVLAPSASVAELLRQKGLRRVHVWPRGVDVERFHPERRSDEWRLEICGRSRKGLPLILYVGRLAREKNLQTLVDVARQMKGVHWVLVGDGPERGALAEGLRGSVCTFTGYLTGEDLATAYASADVFFMPSTTEGCPNAVMEAFASGLPVVGADAFGTGDLIAESGAGLAFSPSSTREAREALEALLGDQEMWRLCRVRGRAFAEARSWDVLMARLLKYYDKARAFNELGHGLP